MKWIQFVLLFLGQFIIAASITASSDAAMISVISNHGKWAVQSDCTSASATTSAISVSEGFKAGLSIGFDYGYSNIPFIGINLYGQKINLSKKTQLKYTLAGNEFTGDGWICQKNRCSPKDGDSAAKILKQFLANEGHLVITITDNNKVIQATFDTTGLNESYQDLLK